MGLVSLFVIAIISLGTYAIWNSELLTGDSTIKSGQIKMSYTETNEITMENALPMKDEEGKVLEKYFDFQVLTYIKTRANDNTQRKLSYDVILEPLTVETSLKDNEIKVYLTMVENGKETEVVKPTTIDKLINYLLNTHEDIFSNNKGEVITSYRLRAWVDEKVDPAKFNEKKYSYKFRVNVNSGKINELVEADTSGANAPELTSNMIPVYYDEKNDVWKKADTSNKNSNWYNYDKKKWANAVTISEYGNYDSVVNGSNIDYSIESEFYYTEPSLPTGGNSNVTLAFQSDSVYYYSCCQTTKPSFDRASGYFKYNGTWTRNDSLVGKYCSYGDYKDVSGSCQRSSSLNYMKSRGTLTTSRSTTYYNYFLDMSPSPTKIHSASKYKISNTYTYDANTGKYTLTNPITKLYTTSYVNYYLCEDKVSTSCSAMYRIKAVDNDTNTITKVDSYGIKRKSNVATDHYQVGDEIPMNKINTMWVWIPRYTYTYLSTNTPEEIKIKFESGTDSSGTIKCQDSVTGTSSKSETCTDSTNGSLKAGTSTYTHPAFWWDKNDNSIRETGEELTGIWVGKFEVSSDTTCTPSNNATAGIGCNLQTIRPQIKPNVTSWRGASIGTFFNGIQKMRESGNKYGFNTTDETHMMKNMEWGAVAYLSHSKYGINKEININNSSDYYTGRSGGNIGGSTAINTVYTDQTSTEQYNKYGFYTYDGYLLNYDTNIKSEVKDMSKIASSTGNIYGIYDLSGGAFETMMGNMVYSNGQPITGNTSYDSEFTGYVSNGTLKNGTYAFPQKRYYDKYEYGTDSEIVKGKLGDATKEMALVGDKNTWYSKYDYYMEPMFPWARRSGSYEVSGHLFASFYENGYSYTFDSTRAVISNLK